jgi:UDP-GlcNAc:undecaprenyl-phosphate/decaprenyl-phosphate GlcNAc-1-phosphate transferase
VSALAAAAAFPATAAVIWATLHTRFAGRVVAAPSGERWHTESTSSLGGVGIFAGLLTGVGVAMAVGAVPASEELIGILAGCGLLFAAGLADDLFALGPLAKVGAQLGAGAIVLSTGLKVQIVSNPVLATAIALLWLVGMTNAFNLLDNMDGLAATLAGIASAFFAIDAVTVHPNRTVLVLSLAVALACAGFLPFNLRPRSAARIFMGDSGSQVLGFALAALGLSASWKVAGTTVATLLLPILILAVPILDTTLVTVIRLLEGRSVAQGGRDHASHRLVYAGLSEKRAVILLGVISAALGGTSLAYNVVDDWRITLLGVLVTFALLVQFASFLADIEKGPRVLEDGRFGFLVVHRRRFAEVLVDFALVTASFGLAYLLRVEGQGTVSQRHIFEVSLPIVLAARYLAFIPFGLYRGVSRYAGARDATSVVLAVVCSEILAFAFIAATRSFGDFPRSIFVIDALVCIALIGVSRFWERAIVRALGSMKGRADRRRTLIVGAGSSGRSLLRELRETPGEVVVGFVDDDPVLRRRRIQGVAVLGDSDEVERILGKTAPDTVFVTIPNADRSRLDSIVAACERAGIPCRFVRRETDLEPSVVLGAAAE